MAEDYEDEDNGLDDWDSSMGLHFSIDFDLANNRLTQQQRSALRRMVLSAVEEATCKVQLLGLEKHVKVYAEERASGAGVRRMVVPREDTHE